MRIETVNGRKLVCGHIFPHSELAVGQRWAPADGGDYEVTIVEVNEDYVWHESKFGKIRKDAFGFQVRYCKIVD